MKNIFTLLLACVFTFTMNAQFPEDFENGIPAGWTVAGNFMLGDATASASDYFAPTDHTNFMWTNDDALLAGGDGSGFVYTGDVDLTAYTNPLLKMESYFIDGDWDGDDEYARVHVSTDGGTTWTEVANLAGTGGVWVNTPVNISAYGGMTVQLAFEYGDGGGWNYGWAFDDITVEEYSILDDVIILGREASCTGGITGAESVISGSFQNNGINTVTSLDISYTDGTNTVNQTLTGLNVPLFGTASFEFDEPYPVETAANIVISVNNPNGSTDEDMSNNTATGVGIAGAVTPVEQRAVLAEEATGTWCQWCPRGTVFMDRMADCYGDHFVGIAVHNEDPMALAEHNDWVLNFPGFGGFPSVIMNRSSIIDPGELESPTSNGVVTAAAGNVYPCADWDAATRALTVTANGLANTDMTGDFRVVGFLIEDGLSGTSTDWNQSNAYAGGGNGPMGGFENLPASVPAAQMVYDHVSRAIFGGANGAEGSVPVGLTAGQTFTHTFDTYTVPADVNMDNVHIAVALLAPNGSVVNAWSVTPEDAIACAVTNTNDLKINNTLAKVFPNPFSDVTNVRLELTETAEVTMSVYNMMGQKIATRNYGQLNGEQVLPFDGSNLSAGTYMIHITVNNTLITKRVTLAK